MGNEALDLDSTVSSVLLANLYHHYYMMRDSSEDEAEVVDVLPLLPVDRRDFVLRQEAFALVERVGVAMEHLLFLDDLHNEATSVQVH